MASVDSTAATSANGPRRRSRDRRREPRHRRGHSAHGRGPLRRARRRARAGSAAPRSRPWAGRVASTGGARVLRRMAEVGDGQRRPRRRDDRLGDRQGRSRDAWMLEINYGRAARSTTGSSTAARGAPPTRPCTPRTPRRPGQEDDRALRGARPWSASSAPGTTPADELLRRLHPRDARRPNSVILKPLRDHARWTLAAASPRASPRAACPDGVFPGRDGPRRHRRSAPSTRVDMIMFTGSTRPAKKVMKRGPRPDTAFTPVRARARRQGTR